MNLGNKDARQLHEKLVALGWELVRRTGGNHLAYRHTVTGATMFVPGTPSDHRSAQNALATARRVAKGS